MTAKGPKFRIPDSQIGRLNHHEINVLANLQECKNAPTYEALRPMVMHTESWEEVFAKACMNLARHGYILMTDKYQTSDKRSLEADKIYITTKGLAALGVTRLDRLQQDGFIKKEVDEYILTESGQQNLKVGTTLFGLGEVYGNEEFKKLLPKVTLSAPGAARI